MCKFAKNTIICVAATMLLVGCTDAPQQEVHFDPSTPINLDSSQIQAVKSGVRAVMKDPESARFGQIAASRDTKGIISVCGFVNGRNSFGGYTGDQPFIGILLDRKEVPLSKRFVLASDFGSDEDSARAIILTCRKSGVGI